MRAVGRAREAALALACTIANELACVLGRLRCAPTISLISLCYTPLHVLKRRLVTHTQCTVIGRRAHLCTTTRAAAQGAPGSNVFGAQRAKCTRANAKNISSAHGSQAGWHGNTRTGSPERGTVTLEQFMQRKCRRRQGGNASMYVECDECAPSRIAAPSVPSSDARDARGGAAAGSPAPSHPGTLSLGGSQPTRAAAALDPFGLDL